MTLTKKRVVLVTIFLTVAYFTALFFLPENVIGGRDDNVLLFAPKILFIAAAMSILTAFVLVFMFKRDFISWQKVAFNRYKHYLWLLIKRDFVTRYRKSIMGVLWSILNPVLNMLVLAFVFQYMFRWQMPDVNTAVYILTGQFIFNFFSESTTLSMTSVIGSEGVIRKVYVPKWVFPLSKVCSSLVNMGFSLIAVIVVVAVTGSPFHWTMLLIPIPMIFIFVFALGFAMLMSSLTVFFRDLTHLYTVGLMMWMFLTPIIYPISIIPERFLSIYGLNPMLHFVNYMRALGMDGVFPGLWPTLVCASTALIALSVGTYVFMRQQDKFLLNL